MSDRRRIEVEAFCRYTREAATVLVLMGAADDVYPSFLVPGDAVWSLNGEPQLPMTSIDGSAP